MTATGPGDPPDDLDGFPEAGPVAELHRVSEWPGAWWYASVTELADRDGGRFDLAAPRGTCYLAGDSLEGALVQRLLRTPVKVVPAERLEELFHATIEVRSAPPTADLTAPEATGFGLNAEIHSTLDYTKPRRWAAALYADGWRAVRHRLRGDTGQQLAGRALFGGRAGLHARAPAGMSTSVGPLDRAEAERLLAGRNVEVRPIPAHVPIAPPPA